MKKNNQLLDAALDYAARGIPVIPLHNPTSTGLCSCARSDCDRIGKHPRTTHGIKDATTDEGVIRSWWWTWPEANIGIAMGDGRVALDIDMQEALEAWEAQHGDLPKGPRQMSGRPGGEHRIFRCSTKLRNAVKFSPGFDIRAGGGYIVAAPSLHASGREYE